MRPVVENIALIGTDAEDMDKYSLASLLSIGKCCRQKESGTMKCAE